MHFTNSWPLSFADNLQSKGKSEEIRNHALTIVELGYPMSPLPVKIKLDSCEFELTLEGGRQMVSR